MRGRTPLADDTPKRAPPVPRREAAPADPPGGRVTCTEANILPYFSTPTAATKMVTSTSSVDDQPINQSPLNYPKNHYLDKQETPVVYYRTGQTTQDKRSRLSNVINSLYRKVPVNDRNSVERNLETLEKYVMTVLNGVIKDAETEGTDERRKNDDTCYNGPNKESRIIDNEVKPLELSSEPSAVEPAIPSVSIVQQTESDNKYKEEVISEDVRNKLKSTLSLASFTNDTTSINETPLNSNDPPETEFIDPPPEVQSSFKSPVELPLVSPTPDDTTEKIQIICRELLTDLVNEISQTLDEQPNSAHTSLQCSLPLEKVAPVLDICDNTSHSLKSTVRHLCLYCDRKFLSISLRQRHTERVHQIGGGRRSDRNNRKTNCQYCSEKCADNLDALFQHMIASHSDKYHGCLLCSTRYGTRETLVAHTNELHPNERSHVVVHSLVNEFDKSENFKDTLSVKRDNIRSQIKMFTPLKLNMLPRGDDAKEAGSQEFDSSFYNNVSCNIRENLLHHLDGKLYPNSASLLIPSACYQTNFLEPTHVLQCPIDISLTAATPIYNKEYSTVEIENSSEYAQKPGKVNSCQPRRVSFEKYNFPKKYDGKEPWTGIGDLSKFDISTQLTLRKKQQLLKDKLLTLETIKCNSQVSSDVIKDSGEEKNFNASNEDDHSSLETQFTGEFGNFLRLRRWDECPAETVKDDEIVYAELTGEWSRPRVYICGACSSKHQTLKDLEEHKVISHPNVWCSHLEFSGDQTELDKHLVLPGRGAAIMRARDAVWSEKVCTKCLKTCGSLSELHKHMLECGGDPTWLLGLFGNGKKKCKWRPFGSRRRRQRGMKRNIQNSQDSKNQVNKTPKEKQPSGPRIRPSDRESIEKMLANLPAKRSTRKVTQEINLRSQARLCKIQTRSKQRGLEIASNSRLSRKAVLRNKLIKNAKSFQRKRCRGDNISAAIESVISNYDVNTRRSRLSDNIRGSSINGNERIYKNITVVSKRRNIKMQGKTTIKSLKNRKASAIKLVTGGPKITRSNTNNSEPPVTRRKRFTDPLASLSSVKAKSQLRSNDGKFARNPGKNDSTLLDTQLSSSSQSSGTQITRSSSTRFSTRSKERERVNVGLSRRVTRVSSDADKMPTLEPADKLTLRQVESSKSSNELPVLLPAAKVPVRGQNSSVNSSFQGTNGKQIVVNKKRGRRSNLGKSMEKGKQKMADKFEETGENAKIIQTRNRKSQEFPKQENEWEDKFQNDLPAKKSNSQSTSFSTKKSTSVSPVKTTDSKRTRRSRRNSLEEAPKFETPSLEAVIANTQVKTPVGKGKRNSKQTNQKPVKPKIVQGKRKPRKENSNVNNDNRDISTTRKSPRNLEKKSTPNASAVPMSLKTTENLPSNLEETLNQNESKEPPELSPPSQPETESTELDNKAPPPLPNSPIDAPQSPLAPLQNDPESDPKKLESEDLERGEKMPENVEESPNTDEKPLESKNESPELIEKQSSPIEIINDLVSLSFEHLQQESSNSNIDSGKENSSETPINITKSKIPKPKKVRGLKRDRGQSKRNLNNVIGILTEGVNIPIEVQQSVVLTVQTSIESLNIQSHNSNMQSEGSRVELGDNNIANGGSNSINAHSTSGDASLSLDSLNKDTNESDSVKIEGLGERPSDEASTPSGGEVQLSEPDLKINNTSNNPPAGTNTVEQFSNDIILDLSRRKQNGKGSFLEKIVSKIAKQKDALLDNDVGSLLDNAVDELSIILDDVGPKSIENDIEVGLKSPQACDSLSKQNEYIKTDSTDVSIENETKIPAISTPDNTSEENESNKTNESIPTTPPDMNNIPALQSINQDDSREIERTSKKRSSDTTLPTKNKRKTVNEDDPPDTKIEDDMYLSDIMKLINSPTKVTSSSPITCADTIEESRIGKRKITETEEDKLNDTANGDSSLECDPYASVGNKKSRRNQRATRKEDKSITGNNRGRRSNRRNTSANNSRNRKAETSECELVGDEEKLSVNNIMDEDKMQMPESPVILNESLKIDETVESKKNVDSFKEILAIVPIDDLKKRQVTEKEIVPEKSIKSKRRGASKKKSLADEHLDLSDDEIRTEENLTSKTEVDLEGMDSDKSRVNTSDPLVDKRLNTMNNLESSSLQVTCHVTSNSLTSVTFEEDKKTRPMSPVAHKEPRSSKRRNNHGRIEMPEIEVPDKQNDTPVQRRQTLKRKAKENIFLIDELLDFGDDIDSPPEVNIIKDDDKKDECMNVDNQREVAKGIKDAAVVQTIKENSLNSLENHQVNEMKQIEPENPPIEDLSKNNAQVIDDPNPPVTTNTDPIVCEPAIDDETQSPKKRASGNFAVVHTKSGEILIVEKKKKFTKEAARFFCDVCATSFTRKSSLKKHNLSQSHILQVSKCSNEQDSLSLSETAPAEVASLENSFLLDENSHGKVLSNKVEEKRAKEEVVVEAPLANSTIDTIETTVEPEPFNSQLEEELLDEEICKITENMTHDEYVLTDHISPEGEEVETAEKLVNETDTIENLKSKQKVNLANEHLAFESPHLSLKHPKPKDQLPLPTLITDHIITPSTAEIHPTTNHKMSLDFSNITEKLKGNKFLQNDEKSVSIESADKTPQVKEDITPEVEVNNSESIEEIKIFDTSTPKKSKSSLDKSSKKSKTRTTKRSKKKSLAESLASESDDSGTENVKSQDKNKIVKSVFGRAFTGEKLDKVMEVLDDWNSKSEDDSQDECPQSPSGDKVEKNRTMKEPRDKILDKPDRRSKSNKPNQSLPIEMNSRCRQSKKRAEERISRAFEEESMAYDLAFVSIEKQSPLKITSTILPLKTPENDSKVNLKCKKSPESNCPEDENKQDTLAISTFPIILKCKIMNDEVSQDTNSMESIHTRVPSCPRERSSTPDLISVTTKDSYNETEDFVSGINDDDDDDDDDEQMSVRGRLSPFYASNAPESSMTSETMSTINHVNNTEGFIETRRGNSNEFSGEKIVIRSPILSCQESCPGVVTIAPTDAIEDNALDVPQEIEGMKEKPGIARQGKVLNFDEELFVECCSRLKATTENELRGAKKIKIDPTDDYQSRDETTQQSSQGHRQLHDRWRDVESQNSLGSLLESVNQLLGEEMYNNTRTASHKRRTDHQVSPVTTPQTDFIRPDNISYEDSLDVAFEHNNKLRDKIQQRMRESENMIATSFSQRVTSRNYRPLATYYDPQHDKTTAEKLKPQEDNFSSINYSKHIPLEPLPIKNKINPHMDGFLDEALSNLLHRNGKHDHNGSTPMNMLAELACAQVPSITPSSPKIPEKSSKTISTPHRIDKDFPKKSRNPIKELFERKKELNDRKKSPIITKQRSNKKSKHHDNSPLIRKSQFGVGLVERKRRHNEKKFENSSSKRVKDVYDFDDEDSGDTKFSSKPSYRFHTEKVPEPIINYVKSKDSNINVDELMSRTIAKSLDNGKCTESSGKRLDSMINRKFQQSDLFIPKTKGALKSFTMEKSQVKNSRDKLTTGPMDNFVERKHHRSRRSTEGSGKTTKTKRKNKSSKKRSRNAWYEDDSSDEFVTAFKAENVGVGITKSQRTCSKGKQNLFAELSSTSSESEHEESPPDEKKEDKSMEINEWMDGVKAETKDLDDSEKIESDSPLIIDEKESDGDVNSDNDDDDNRSERGFELDDLYREDSSVASSDSDVENHRKTPPKDNFPDIENKKFEDNDLIPLDEALVLLDAPHHENKSMDQEESIDKDEMPVDLSTEDLPEKLSSNEKPNEKTSDNLPLHVFLSRKVQESKKKKEEKLKKLQKEKEMEKERAKKREQDELVADVESEKAKDQFIEFQSTRRQRKCAIGKQGLLAEISSSDEEYYYRDTEKRTGEKVDCEKSKRQKRESKEKRKERYMEKKHELMIAKEQKAIEDEILREVKMKRSSEGEGAKSSDDNACFNQTSGNRGLKKERVKYLKKIGHSDTENKCNRVDRKTIGNRRKEGQKELSINKNDKKEVIKRSKKATKSVNKKPKPVNGDTGRRNSKERRRDTDDEELRTTKSWNKVDEGVGVAIGRRKRAAANQLYYWSSSTDDDDDDNDNDEEVVQTVGVVEEEDERQEQHGWIVGDSHKKMITMLAMEKQLKEKRRRSEDEFEGGKMKNKKHRNSTS